MLRVIFLSHPPSGGLSTAARATALSRRRAVSPRHPPQVPVHHFLTLASFDSSTSALESGLSAVGQRLVRMAVGWVSLRSAAMGLIWALADHETRTWHDHMSQTFVTYDLAKQQVTYPRCRKAPDCG